MYNWLLSFVDSDSRQNIGCVLIQCESDRIQDALKKSWDERCNPGGIGSGTLLSAATVGKLKRKGARFSSILTKEEMLAFDL